MQRTQFSLKSQISISSKVDIFHNPKNLIISSTPKFDFEFIVKADTTIYCLLEIARANK